MRDLPECDDLFASESLKAEAGDDLTGACAPAEGGGGVVEVDECSVKQMSGQATDCGLAAGAEADQDDDDFDAEHVMEVYR